MSLPEWLNSSYYGISISSVVGTVVILAIASVLILYFTRLFRRLLLSHRHRLHLSYEAVVFIMRLVRIALWVGIAFLVLDLWGAGVSGLWTALASLLAVIGVGFLAVWTMVSNVTANLFLTIWRPFRLGSTVNVLPENFKGKVVEVNMMFTVLREEEGGLLYIPNNIFFQKVFRVDDKKHLRLYETFEIDKGLPRV